MNWLRRKTVPVPPLISGVLVCLDEVTYEQYCEDRPHLMRAADRGGWIYARNLTVPSGRTWRLEEL